MIEGEDLQIPIDRNQPMRFIAGLIDSIHSVKEEYLSTFKQWYGNKSTYLLDDSSGPDIEQSSKELIEYSSQILIKNKEIEKPIGTHVAIG